MLEDHSTKWMPKWVGRTYTTLWIQFRDQPFSFEEAALNLLGKPVPNLLSELRRNQALFICGRDGRKRIYRLVSPTLYVDAIARKVNLDWLKQGFYANFLLQLVGILCQHYEKSLQALALFGSLARNAAQSESDIDLLIILDDLPDGMGTRLKMLLEIQEIPEIRGELAFLRERGLFPRISFYPLKPDELEKSPFLIDASFDLKILHDRGVLGSFLREIQVLVHTRNVERKTAGKGKYYLDMHIPYGEVDRF